MAYDLSDDDLDTLNAMAGTQDSYQPAPLPAASMPGAPTPTAQAPVAMSGPPAPPNAAATPLPPAPQVAAPAQMPGSPSPLSFQIASSESGNNPNPPRNPQSTAGGKWQITDPTLLGIMQRHPELANIPDPKNSQQVYDALQSDNTAYLQAHLGRTVTPTDQVAAWFLGAQGAVRFLQADPNTPVDRVVGQDQLNANKTVFYNPDGSARTVGQVYAMEAQKVSGSPQMAASGSQPGAAPQPVFQQAQALFGPSQQALADYIKNQPGMWQKLQEMQNQYMQAAKPTAWDASNDLMSKIEMQVAAANAQKNATAGGVIYHELPSSKDFIDSLQAGHQIDLQQRQRQLDLAKTGYETGSQNLLAQNQQAMNNLNAQTGLTKDAADYALASGTRALQLAQFSQQQQMDISNYIKEAVPNPITRGKIMTEIAQNGGGPQLSYSANRDIIDKLAAQHQQGGDPLNMPGRQIEYTWTTNGQSQTKTIDENNPPLDPTTGKTWVPPQNATPRDLGATQITATSSTGTGSGTGSGTAPAPEDIHTNMMKTQAAAQSALALIDYMRQNGMSTGPLTNPSNDVRGALAQAGVLDETGQGVRMALSALLGQLHASEELPEMKSAGRASKPVADVIASGQIPDDAPLDTIRGWVSHVNDYAGWTADKTLAMSQKGDVERANRNAAYNPATESMLYNQKHPIPIYAPVPSAPLPTNVAPPGGPATAPLPTTSAPASPNAATTPEPQRPANVPVGSRWSDVRRQWMNPTDGTIYDAQGRPVGGGATPTTPTPPPMWVPTP